MQTHTAVDLLKEKMMDLYVRYRETINANDTPKIKEIRDKAIQVFNLLGFPTQKLEEWRQYFSNSSINSSFVALLGIEITFEKIT